MGRRKFRAAAARCTRMRLALASAVLAACTRQPPPAPPPSHAALPDAATPVAELAPPDAGAPARDCAPRPIEPPTATCAPPPDDVVARVHDFFARISVGPSAGGWVVEPTYGCDDARGWLMSATLEPAKDFHGGTRVDCPPARGGDCGVVATWLVPPHGAPQLQRDLELAETLDIDGDGHAETLTTDRKTYAQTVWFARGTRPVVMPHGGWWTPWQHGYVRFVGDGDPTLGFVREGAHVSRVTPAGLADAPDIADALWRDTVAARCPAANVLADGPLDAPTGGGVPSCIAPGAALETQLAAQVTDQLVARARDRARYLIDGRPAFQWSCNRTQLAAVVTYCEGAAESSCVGGDNKSDWVHDVWVGTPAELTLLDRFTSGSEIMEWSVNSMRAIVGYADLDGDGEPDPILDTSSHEGGATRSEHSFVALVGGRLVELDAMSVATDHTIAVLATRPAKRASDLLVIASFPLDAKQPEVSHVFEVRAGKARVLTGSTAAAATRAAITR